MPFSFKHNLSEGSALLPHTIDLNGLQKIKTRAKQREQGVIKTNGFYLLWVMGFLFKPDITHRTQTRQYVVLNLL